ncbi:C40 family peptidase [Actinomadura sp. SCN-SB]|uniref:C40 family peptidase n=1 Tax=Actinomadura sp. SCN-SB TaxID=3373092 RepID=UPI0037509505
MTPAPRERRFAMPAIASAAVVVFGAGAPIAAQAAVRPAHAPAAASAAALAAAPSPSASSSARTSRKPTEGELRKRLDALNTEAEKLTERYNKARVDLDRARRAEQDAAKTAAALEAQVAPARQELARLAAADYMTGGPDMLFSGGDTGGLAASAYLARNQAAVVNRLQAQIDRANAARRAAAAHTAQVRRAAAEAETARAAAKAKVDEVTKQLDKLTTTIAKDPRTGLKATVKGSGLPAKMARKALTKLGSPYVWAAAGPNSFDCSGLVVWAYAQVGKSGLPHYTGALVNEGTKVSRDRLRSGDLVYFGASLHHMGIYLGDGMFLHAPQTGDVVKISKLSDRSDFAAANRIE